MPYKDPQKLLEWRRQYYRKHKKTINIRARKWKEDHFERWVFVDKEWRQKNKEHRRDYQNQWNAKLKLEVLSHYSGNLPKCACCGEAVIEFLTIDHMDDNGAENRKITGHGSKFYKWLVKNNFPEGYQVLCYNCNCGRAKTKDKICPHKRIEHGLSRARFI